MLVGPVSDGQTKERNRASELARDSEQIGWIVARDRRSGLPFVLYRLGQSDMGFCVAYRIAACHLGRHFRIQAADQRGSVRCA